MNNDNTGNQTELENNCSSLTVPSDNGSAGSYQDWRSEVWQALSDAGLSKESEAFWRCGGDDARFSTHYPLPVDLHSNFKSLFVCDQHPEHEVVVCRETCHLRICPDCARRAAARLIARYVPVALELAKNAPPGYRMRKIVLTTPIDLRDPEVKIKIASARLNVPQLFDKLLPPGWRTSQGFICADEFGPHGGKLHFHILFYGQFISNKAKDGYPLANAWSELTGGECYVTHISSVNYEDLEHELIETVKYVTKFWKTDETGALVRLSPDLAVALLRSLRGSRRVRSYGVFFGLPALASDPLTCPECGGTVSRWTPLQWNIFCETGWRPDEQSRLLILRPGNKSPPERGELPSVTSPKPETDLGRPRNPTMAALPGMVASSPKHSSRFPPN